MNKKGWPMTLMGLGKHEESAQAEAREKAANAVFETCHKPGPIQSYGEYIHAENSISRTVWVISDATTLAVDTEALDFGVAFKPGTNEVESVFGAFDPDGDKAFAPWESARP